MNTELNIGISYDALREEVLSLTDEECEKLLIVLGIVNPAHI